MTVSLGRGSTLSGALRKPVELRKARGATARIVRGLQTYGRQVLTTILVLLALTVVASTQATRAGGTTVDTSG